MKISSNYLLHTAAALLICASVASCADDEMAIGKRPVLQPGEYPLTLTATVGEMTSRTDGKETWLDGDSIAVRIGEYPNVGCYMLNSDGTVMSAEKSLDWHTTEESTVRAWFPYVDLNEVKTVSIADQSQGFKEYDFLTAVEENQIYTNAVNLNFKHQMAKVSCKILPGDGISDDEWKSVTVSIGGFTKASFSNGTLSGDYDDNNKWITPVYDAEASADNTLVYEALVVPQDMRGKDFIKIDIKVNHNGTVIDKTLIYQPNEATADLKAGTHYSYSVIVQKDRLEVQSLSAEWEDDGKWHPAGPAVFHVNLPEDVTLPPDMTFSENVRSEGKYLLVKGNRFTISYEVTDDNMTKVFQIYTENRESDRDIVNRTLTKFADDKYIYFFNYYLLSEEVDLKYVDFVQVGDYYYDNGTWGPLELKGDKTPVGVVFKVGAGSTEVYNNKDDKADYGWEEDIRGYAVALKDAVDDPINWGASKTAVVTIGSYPNQKMPYSGYNHTKKIKEWGEKGNAYYAVKAVLDYQNMTKAPEGSSGWYLPAIQQLIEIQNIPDRANLFTVVDGDDVKPGTTTEAFGYWSCLEVTSSKAWALKFDTGDNQVQKIEKLKDKLYVRAVLTF